MLREQGTVRDPDDVKPSVLRFGCAEDAAGEAREVDGIGSGVAAEGQNDLVRIADRGEGALRGDETSELRGRQVGRLHMHVRVDERGQAVESVLCSGYEFHGAVHYTKFGSPTVEIQGPLVTKVA